MTSLPTLVTGLRHKGWADSRSASPRPSPRRPWLARGHGLRRQPGFHGVAGQCQKQGPRVTDAVPVLGYRARRRTYLDQAGLARRHCPRIAAPGGGRRDAAAIVGERLRLDRDLPRGTGDGRGGTVYLCHPFLVHAAQPHRGTRPRFMAQPPLLPRAEFDPALPPRPSRTPSAEPAGWRSEAGRVRGVMSCDMGLYYPVRHSAVSGRHEYAQGSQS